MSTRLAPLSLVVLTAACAGLSVADEPPPPDPMSLALTALGAGNWDVAGERLREIAARCESGENGEDAVLLLGLMALDPRNPEHDPDEAAAWARHVLSLPGIDAVRVHTAETLYLAAVEVGAGIDPATGATGTGGLGAAGGTGLMGSAPAAARFHSCDGDEPVFAAERTPPHHPGTPLALRLQRASARADSLAAVANLGAEDTIVVGDEAGKERLQARIRALEAELARIRELLRKGG